MVGDCYASKQGRQVIPGLLSCGICIRPLFELTQLFSGPRFPLSFLSGWLPH